MQVIRRLKTGILVNKQKKALLTLTTEKMKPFHSSRASRLGACNININIKTLNLITERYALGLIVCYMYRMTVGNKSVFDNCVLFGSQ